MNRLEEIDHRRLHQQEDSTVIAERDSLSSVSQKRLQKQRGVMEMEIWGDLDKARR